MKCRFEVLSAEHRTAVIDIFNFYVENSFAAYPAHKVPYEFFDRLMDTAKGYPAYAMIDPDSGNVSGFCMLKPYHPFDVFGETAEISYFIAPSEVGKGLGSEALILLENRAREKGIRQILASISSLNEQSLSFHERHGFIECGRFQRIGKKNNIYFDVVWMQKEIQPK